MTTNDLAFRRQRASIAIQSFEAYVPQVLWAEASLGGALASSNARDDAAVIASIEHYRSELHHIIDLSRELRDAELACAKDSVGFGKATVLKHQVQQAWKERQRDFDRRMKKLDQLRSNLAP